MKDKEKLLKEITEAAAASMPHGTVYDDGFDDFLINADANMKAAKVNKDDTKDLEKTKK